MFKADLRVSVPCFYAAKFTCVSAYHIFKDDLRVSILYLEETLDQE